jgi:hypothetical protein
MSLAADNLWNVTVPGRQVDPIQLADALSALSESANLDFRTRVLIRDSLGALETHWGHETFAVWMRGTPGREMFEQIVRQDLGPPGFASLEKRVVEPTRPEIVLQLLRELGLRVQKPTRIEIGGSIALILSGHLSRMTEDIDVVDEIPPELRSQHELLDETAARYHLRLTHFQSHFLPAGWEARLRSLGRFGQLDVFLIDPCDIFVSKLFSARAKDLDDLRILSSQVEKGAASERVHHSAKAMLAEADLAENARRNWYVLYGESLAGV